MMLLRFNVRLWDKDTKKFLTWYPTTVLSDDIQQAKIDLLLSESRLQDDCYVRVYFKAIEYFYI